MTLEEKLTAAEARIAELESQLQNERASITALNQRVTEAETARNEESALNAQLQSELKSLRQQHQDATAKITKLEADAKSAEAKAAEICASVGVTPLPVTPQGDRNSEDLAEQLKAQKSPAEQTAFWRKHKDRILNRK